MILVILVVFVSLLITPVARADPQVDDIAGQLACQCGCGLTALACGGAMQCDVGDQMVALIRTKVDQGESKEQILAYFVSQYGEKVLAAPTRKGFNLTAWVTPFLAVAVGGMVVFFVLRSWLLNRGVRQEVESEAPADLGRYGERIDRELEQFG